MDWICLRDGVWDDVEHGGVVAARWTVTVCRDTRGQNEYREEAADAKIELEM